MIINYMQKGTAFVNNSSLLFFIQENFILRGFN